MEKKITAELLIFLISNYYSQYLISVFIIIIIILNFIKSNNNKLFLLSDLIRKNKKIHQTFKRKLYKIDITKVYEPSLYSFSIISFFFLTMFFGLYFLKLGLFSYLGLCIKISHASCLIAIQSGLAIIIFALIIFIAESVKDDEITDKARVLLKVSFLYPLVIITILNFISYIFTTFQFSSMIITVLLAFASIFSLTNIVKVLLNKSKFIKERINLLKDRHEKCIDITLDERLGNNILAKKINDDKVELTLPFFPIDDPSLYHHFRSNKSGIITDINFIELDNFTKTVEKEANKNNYSFYENKVKSPSSTDNYTPAELETYHVNQKRYLLKRYKYEVKENDALLCVDKNLIQDEDKIRYLNKCCRRIFSITPSDNLLEQFKQELFGVKDQFIDSINNKKIGRIDNYYKIYSKLAESFLKRLHDYENNYTSKNALDERRSVYESWETIQRIGDDIIYLLRLALTSNDKEIIGKVGFLPFEIIRTSIKYNDHYIFQQFIRYAEIMYDESRNIVDNDIKCFILDRSWRWLKEIAEVNIESQLNHRTLSDVEILSLKNFATYFFIVFKNLIRQSFKNKDFESFKQYLKTAMELFNYFTPSQNANNVISLNIQLNNLSSDSEEEIINLNNKLDCRHILEKIEKEINEKKNQLSLHVANMALRQFKSNPDCQEFKAFFLEAEQYLPEDIIELTDVYLKIYDREVDRFWGYDL